MKVPFHVDFEELNLRFYVKRFENGEWRRGVVFIKEIDSEAEFITEHYFGYTKIDSAKTFEYEVTHPRWQQYEVLNYAVDVDFGKNYGTDFEFLQNQKPTSVFLAKGSKIGVKNKRKLQTIPVLEKMY